MKKQKYKRALIMSLVVGSSLILINQGDLIFSGQVDQTVLIKIITTPFVPFFVSL